MSPRASTEAHLPEAPLQAFCYAGGPFGENAYLVRSPSSGSSVAIDPGAGATAMVRALRESGDTLEAIYLTHSHFDHIEGIPVLRAHSLAPIFLHPEARPLYDLADRGAAAFGLRLPAPLPAPDRPLVPGESVPVGDQALEVRFAPGHAPGHVILYSPESSFALVGDVIFDGSIGRTDLPGGDFKVLMASIRREVLSLPDETRILSGHGPETTVGRQRRGNPFLISQVPGELA